MLGGGVIDGAAVSGPESRPVLGAVIHSRFWAGRVSHGGGVAAVRGGRRADAARLGLAAGRRWFQRCGRRRVRMDSAAGARAAGRVSGGGVAALVEDERMGCLGAPRPYRGVGGEGVWLRTVRS